MAPSDSLGPRPVRSVHIPRNPSPEADEFRLSLLGAFELTQGAVPIALPGSSKRLLAFLGVRDRTVTRSSVAGTLWPDSSDAHAQASLRTLLSRLDQATRDALRISVLDLSLAEGVEVDLRDSQALAHRLLIVDLDAPDTDLTREAIEALSSDLLPDSYEDWTLLESERWHALRVRALEALAQKLAVAGRWGDAAEAAQHVIVAEPLRESAYAVMIGIQQAQGDPAGARITFDRYRQLVRSELNIEPSPALEALITSPIRLTPHDSAIREVQTALAGEATRDFEVVASGISMEPSIRHGDKLFVSPDVDLDAGRIVIATHRGAWIVKRLALRDGKLVLRSDNVDEEVPLADVEVKGVVVELRRTV